MGDPSSAWGPPQAPMGMMQGPNGQMGGPPMNLGAPMGPNMMQSYQGWGTSPGQQSYAGYGTPSGPGSYQGWGAPPAPQGPPPQWGNNYGGPPQQQGYGSYGKIFLLSVYKIDMQIFFKFIRTVSFFSKILNLLLNFQGKCVILKLKIITHSSRLRFPYL